MTSTCASALPAAVSEAVTSASRAMLAVSLSRQLARTEDKLERALQEVEELRDELMTAVVAGHETTATAIAQIADTAKIPASQRRRMATGDTKPAPGRTPPIYRDSTG